MDKKIRKVLLGVEKPFRYAGGEVGSTRKKFSDADVRICLAFPDVYEIGTSHLGLSILYQVLNDLDGVCAERVFTPWTDMENALRESGTPLFSLESKTPLKDFDVIGVSLAYELTYTNALCILDLARVPLLAKERKDGDPIVIAGGPCAYNPFPVLDFFDAFAIGDGEVLVKDVAREIADAKKNKLSRKETIEKLSKIKGIYVPHCNEKSAVRRVEPDLNEVFFPKKTVVSYAAVQQRLAIEVARGCTRGCRFCQAGYIYRPQRQRKKDIAVEIARDGLCNTGSEELSFLSLSIGDWAPLCDALKKVHEVSPFQIDASLPSLRAETLTSELLNLLGRARAGSFTLAPEAGTERLRFVINKGNTDEDLFASVERAFECGWHAIKLYFMIGLPTETEEDLEGIITTSNKCLDIGKKYHRRPEVTVSTSLFVPKPHTPFQWEPQLSAEQTLKIQHFFKARLRRPGLFYRWHNAQMSFLEGMFARGGEELCEPILRAFKSGARFDGWDEKFNFAAWQNAFNDSNLSMDPYISERPNEFVFPWDKISIGPSKEFLRSEREKGRNLLLTADCAHGACAQCGLCDLVDVKNVIEPADVVATPSPVVADGVDVTEKKVAAPVAGSEEVFKYRVTITKLGPSAFLGGVEMTDVIRVGIRASGLPATYSSGFHPRVKVGVGPAPAVGVESQVEFFDLELYKKLSISEIVAQLQNKFPVGMDVVSAREIVKGENSIQDSIAGYVYEMDVSDYGVDVPLMISRFNDSAEFKFNARRGQREKVMDLKLGIRELAAASKAVVRAYVNCNKDSPRPSEIAEAIFGLSHEDATCVGAVKKEVIWRELEKKEK